MLEKWISYNGKDPTKVDRSAAYAARYVAKNLVAAGIAHRCEIQIAYAIGVANPVSVSVNTFGTGVIQEEQILKLIDEFFDLRPLSIINGLENLFTSPQHHMGTLDEKICSFHGNGQIKLQCFKVH